MDIIEFSTSNRGRPIVIRQERAHLQYRKRIRHQNFLALQFLPQNYICRLQTIGSTVLKSLGAHNHLAEPKNAKKQKAYDELKKRAGSAKVNPLAARLRQFQWISKNTSLPNSRQLNTPRKLFIIREKRNFRLYQKT